MNTALLGLRITPGLLLMGHGLQKLVPPAAMITAILKVHSASGGVRIPAGPERNFGRKTTR